MGPNKSGWRIARQPEVAVPLLAGAATGVAVWEWAGTDLIDLYKSGMRASLFTGLFTLSGFLLTAKTFLILNMKKEVYGTDVYLKDVKKKRKSVSEWPIQGEGLNVYRPLCAIGDLLTANVVMTLSASVLQFSLGLVSERWAVGICLGWATGAVALLAFSLVYIARNLRAMYDHFEREAREKINNATFGE